MLRAVTDPMVNVFVVLVGAGAAVTLLLGRLTNTAKVVVIVASVVFIGLLKVFDAKFWGVVVMGGAVVIMFFLPWLDYSPVRSIRYRPSWHKYVYGVFVINFFVLGYLGVQPPSPIGERVSQVGTLFYFGFFLLMPWWSRLGDPKPVPERITFAAH
jgi:ubiquinol-cytochrome c reductase cytochrome b subunit